MEDGFARFKAKKTKGQAALDKPTIIELTLAGDAGTGFATDDEIARQVKRVVSTSSAECGFVLRIKTGLSDDTVELNKKVHSSDYPCVCCFILLAVTLRRHICC